MRASAVRRSLALGACVLAIAACRSRAPRSDASGAPSAMAAGSVTPAAIAAPSSSVAAPLGSASRAPSAVELAFVAPVVPGEKFAGWDVTAVRPVERGMLDVVLEHGTEIVVLHVALASDDAPEPAGRAGPYAVYYSIRRSRLVGDFAPRLAMALAKAIERHPDASAPPGLAPFHPAPRPADAL